MKKSRTSKAVDAIMRSRAHCAFIEGNPLHRQFDHAPALTPSRAAARYHVSLSAVSLALKKRLAQKICPACKQVIRGKRKVYIPVQLTSD